MLPVHLAIKFPALRQSKSYITTSPQTPRYNCIAYAAGDLKRWWWPDQFGRAYWPKGVRRATHLAAFQHAFSTLGYELTADQTLEPGIEKIAIYALNSEPKHAARQLRSGLWSSKLGDWEDISHDLADIQGAEYGHVCLIMARRRK